MATAFHKTISSNRMGFTEGLKSFLSETSLHGFKYLGFGHNNIARIYWSIILILSFSYGVYQINDAMVDWSENPVITSVDTIDSPLREIQFPTVTFCHDDYFQPDNWAMTELVFNFFDINDSQLREDFQQFFQLMFDEASSLVANNEFEKNLAKEENVDHVLRLLENNLTTIHGIEELMLESVGLFSTHLKFFHLIEATWKLNESSTSINIDNETRRSVHELFFIGRIT